MFKRDIISLHENLVGTMIFNDDISCVPQFISFVPKDIQTMIKVDIFHKKMLVYTYVFTYYSCFVGVIFLWFFFCRYRTLDESIANSSIYIPRSIAIVCNSPM